MHKAMTIRTLLSLIMMLAAGLAGCARTDHTQALGQAYQELKAPTPNHTSVLAAADAYLADQPAGPMAADAWYLRGRAFQEKAATDRTSPKQDWARAHESFREALNHRPVPNVEGLIHIGLGNILYFQERYSLAMSEFQAGLEKSENNDDKSWALYRIGLCQQRMNQWDSADRTFSSVQQQYPGTIPAQRAREHQGARDFWVEIGVFPTVPLADGVIADLKKLGITNAKRWAQPNGQGPQHVRVGPMTNYESAAALRNNVLPKYTAATIVP